MSTEVSEREYVERGVHWRTEAELLLSSAKAATTIVAASATPLSSQGKDTAEGQLDAVTLLLDTADACVRSAWREVHACVELFRACLKATAASTEKKAGHLLRVVLLRCKPLVLAVCLQHHEHGAKGSGQREEGQEPHGVSMMEAVTTFCTTVMCDAWRLEHSAAESFLLSLATYLQNHYDYQEVQEGRQRAALAALKINLVPFLAAIVTPAGDGEAVNILLPVLLEVLDRTSTGPLRSKVLGAVAQVGACGHEAPYREVALFLIWSYSSAVSSQPAGASAGLTPDEEAERSQALPGALLHMARELQPAALRSDFRQRLFQLCADIGLMLESRSGRSGGEMLGNLLPALAEACRDVNPLAEDCEVALVKHFRSVWFYIALFGLAPPLSTSSGTQAAAARSALGGLALGDVSTTCVAAVAGPYQWRDAWAEAVRRLAVCTPPLVAGPASWVEEELELATLHSPGSRRSSANKQAAALQRTALSAALAGRVDASAMTTISGVRATHLLSITYLEVLRLSQARGLAPTSSSHSTSTASSSPSCSTAGATALKATLEYMRVADMQAPVEHCLSAIVQRAFDACLSSLGLEENVQKRDEALVAHTCFLIDTLGQAEERLRELADSLLSNLRNRFPQVLWSGRCLTALFQLLAEDSKGAPWKAAQLAEARKVTRQRVREWLTFALLLAPCTTQALLQEELRALSGQSHTGHASDLVSLMGGIKLDPSKAALWSAAPAASIPAASAAAAAAAGGRAEVGEGGALDVLSAAIMSATTKSQYVGEIGGMKKLFASLKAQPAALPLPDLTGHVADALKRHMAAAREGHAVDDGEFRDTCLRGAALLLSSSQEDEEERGEASRGSSRSDEILRLLCWGPAVLFTPAALDTGLLVWTWLLAARPLLGVPLMAHVADAWLWTVRQQRGLFDSRPASSGPYAALRPHLCAGEPLPPPDGDPVRDIAAHNIWLGFLLDRLEVARHSSAEQMVLLARLLNGSLASGVAFSQHPAACGALFTLLLLALQWAAVVMTTSKRPRRLAARLLRDRAHRAGLEWFAFAPSWHDDSRPGGAIAEAQAMSAFVKYLSIDERLEASAAGGVHPVWGTAEADHARLRERRQHLLALHCRYEADRLDTWAYTLRLVGAQQRLKASTLSAAQWATHVRTAWSVNPRIAISMVLRFRSVPAVRAEVTALVHRDLDKLHEVAEAVPFFVTPEAAERDDPQLQKLPYWAACPVTVALELLTPPFKGHLRVMAYVLRVLEAYPPDSVTPFMPQLVQALRYDHKGLVEGYLRVAAGRSDLFAHRVIWQLQGEEAPDEESLRSAHASKGGANALWEIVPRVRQSIIDALSPEARGAYEREFKFFDAVTNISSALRPLPKDQRRAAMRPELERVQLESEDVYLPTEPELLVRGIVTDSGVPLQSAKKVPILVAFDVVHRDAPRTPRRQGCIFKVGDDCRQDVLALQVIGLLRDINRAVGLELYLYPYGVIPTGYERGILEVVPNTRSRNQMGEITDGGLFEIFQKEYGLPGSPRFEAARRSFISSSAGYAVASLLLQPKDRHNGNLLIDREGHLVHIDFGFILETSPGGNMRFESADFKLSHEMTQILDTPGQMRSESWYEFVSLCVKGYLAARQHMDGIVSTVLLMKDSGLPCFGRGDPIGNLRKRFHPELTEREAANFMIRTCTEAYNKWTTSGYDLIQYLQQGIEK
eukprot:jgi/Mesen1/9277/ME000060S08706